MIIITISLDNHDNRNYHYDHCCQHFRCLLFDCLMIYWVENRSPDVESKILLRYQQQK